MAKKNEVTKKDDTTALAQYEGFDGAGFENQTAADRMLPMLVLLQKLSPQVDKSEGAYIEGAEPGLILNTVTQDLHESITIVPFITEHVCVEWVPRDAGGGFQGTHAMDSPVVRAAQAEAGGGFDWKTPEGNELQETFNVYAVLLNGDGEAVGGAVIPFKSTQIKVYRQHMERLRQVQLLRPDNTRYTPPLFAHQITIASIPQENKHGKFFNYKLSAPVNNNVRESMLGPDSPVFLAAAELYKDFREGLVQANYEKAGREREASEEAPF